MAKSPIVKEGPNKGWTHQHGDQYKVTGTTVDGKKFSKVYSDWQTAQAINVYRGTKWLIRDGKSFVIQRIYN